MINQQMHEIQSKIEQGTFKQNYLVLAGLLECEYCVDSASERKRIPDEEKKKRIIG